MIAVDNLEEYNVTCDIFSSIFCTQWKHIQYTIFLVQSLEFARNTYKAIFASYQCIVSGVARVSQFSYTQDTIGPKDPICLDAL